MEFWGLTLASIPDHWLSRATDIVSLAKSCQRWRARQRQHSNTYTNMAAMCNSIWAR